MRIAVFSAKGYDRESLTDANAQLSSPHELTFVEARLRPVTAPIADGHDAVCAFVNDDLPGPHPRDDVRDLGVRYVDFETLLDECDVITLHCPLTPATHHLIDADALARARPGVMIVNTSRGALVDTVAVIDALKSGKVGNLAIDVYEEEADLFFEDLSDTVIRDDVFARLLTFPNVFVTAHQAFFTQEAVGNIATTTLGNATAHEQGRSSGNELHAAAVTG